MPPLDLLLSESTIYILDPFAGHVMQEVIQLSVTINVEYNLKDHTDICLKERTKDALAAYMKEKSDLSSSVSLDKSYHTLPLFSTNK